MSFDWRNYLKVAESLTSPGLGLDREAECRVSISRAYYAAYHVTRKHMIKCCKLDDSFGSEHSKLIRAVQDKGRAYNSIYENLRKLRDYRERADYHDVFVFAEPIGNDIHKASVYVNVRAAALLTEIQKKESES